jgi:hypothetical protein
MMDYFEDHGLPLVQLKERRRELVMAMVGQSSLATASIEELSSIQQAIIAMDVVIADLDAVAGLRWPAGKKNFDSLNPAPVSR